MRRLTRVLPALCFCALLTAAAAEVRADPTINEQDFLRISSAETGGEPVTLPLFNRTVNNDFCATCTAQQTTIISASLFVGDHYLNNGMFVGTTTVGLLNAGPDYVLHGTGQAVDSYTFNISAARPVPEPAAALLLSTGPAAPAGFARSRRKGV